MYCNITYHKISVIVCNSVMVVLAEKKQTEKTNNNQRVIKGTLICYY